MGLFSKPKQNSSLPPAPSMPSMMAPSAKPAVDLNKPPVADAFMQKVPMAPPLPEDSLKEVKWQVDSLNPMSLPVPAAEHDSESFAPMNVPESQDNMFDLSDVSLEGLEAPETESKVSVPAVSDNTLTYTPNRPSRKVSNEPHFVTTAQFKRMLEIVEEVKVKVKETSEIHLRLMDIKSEEDIEYESLRKNFQFIEDKLYEVDSIIFEK